MDEPIVIAPEIQDVKESRSIMREVNGVAIYAGVSSKKQNVDLSVSAQLKALREYSSRNSDTVQARF